MILVVDILSSLIDVKVKNGVRAERQKRRGFLAFGSNHMGFLTKVIFGKI
jgi:hypothetical protein